ncbi:MAG: serine/threonine-protein kinase, partial [Acidobacteriota bacterium]
MNAGALKTLKSEYLRHPGARRRFERERQLLAQLKHRNIAHLLDGGEVQGRAFFVMEWVDGEELTHYCSRRSPSLMERIGIFAKICAAVAAAHRGSVIHRDLKPSNILIDKDGEPKLLDFGIAQLLETEDTTPLRTTRLLMTPGYASPEQALGKPVTQASDIFSLGVILHELLTGMHPEAKSLPLSRDLRSHWPSEAIRDHPELTIAEKTALSRRLKGDLDAIVIKARREDPLERYSDVRQLLEDVEAFASGRPVSAQKSTVFYRAAKLVRRNRAASVLLIALSGIAFFFLQRYLSESEKLRTEFANVAAHQSAARLNGNQKTEGLHGMALSIGLERGGLIGAVEAQFQTRPNERKILGNLEHGVFLKGFLAEGEKLFDLTSSPDGRHFVARRDDGALTIWDREKSRQIGAPFPFERRKERGPPYHYPSWSPSGRWFAVGHPRGAWLLDVKEARRLEFKRLDDSI